MEEFILRITGDARALVRELSRAGAYAKAWATTLAEELKDKVGAIFAAGFVLDKAMESAEEFKREVMERILAIKRAQGELPVGSNALVQNVFNYMERVGLSFEEASKPLLKFKQVLDAAKMNPNGPEMKMLERYNIITGEADLKTQSYATSLAKLSKAYLESGKNLKMLEGLMGKQADNPGLLALLELGPERIEKMNNFNPLSNISESAIDLFSGIFGAKKSVSQVASATVANLAEQMGPGVLSKIFGGQTSWFRMLFNIVEMKGRQNEEDEAAIEHVRESIQQETERVALQNKLLDLKQRERDVSAQINDQGKESVSQMAEQARRLTGQRAPQIYGVTSRMREALKIDDLEKKAQVAYLQGNDGLHDSLLKQAQSLRASMPWLMDKDKDPMAKANTELEIIRNELKPVKEMAEMVTKEEKKS